jgi:hypothetical protein
MSISVNLSSPIEWLRLGPSIVGATFLWAGAIKAIAPHTFQNHLRSLGWVPPRLVGWAVTLAAGMEGGWGVALIIMAAPALVYPVTIALLLILTSISWWGVRSGKAKDCGCYGGFVQPSIAQSIALNSMFALLVILAWATSSPSASVQLWQAGLILTTTVGLAALAFFAQRFENVNGRLLFDTSPLKVGRRWKNSWADGATSAIDGEILVAYLGANCPYCSQFVKVANAMVQSPALPHVVGVMSAPDADVREYIQKSAVRFPVVTISQSLMGRLTRAVPTVVIVDQGEIKSMWAGNMPPEIVDRFRDAFFPDVSDKLSTVGG